MNSSLVLLSGRLIVSVSGLDTPVIIGIAVAVVVLIIIVIIIVVVLLLRYKKRFETICYTQYLAVFL